jgi:hypothetical protein
MCTSPLEIPRLMHALPWKFQGSSTGGGIIIGIAQYKTKNKNKLQHFY